MTTSSVDLLPGSTMACASSRARRRRDGRRPAWVAAAIGPGLVVVSSLAVQLGAASSKDVLVVIAPGAVTGVRFSIAAAVLMVLARSRLRGRSRAQWAAIVGFGIVLALSNWSFTEAIARIPLGTAVALEFCGPFAIAALGSRRLRELGSVALAASGVVLIAQPAAAGSASGVGFGLLAGACWAGYTLLSARVGRHTTGLDGLALAAVVAALLAAPATATALPKLDATVVVPLAVSAVLGVVAAFSLELETLRRTDTRTVAVLFSWEPAVAALVGLIALDQVLSAPALLGIGAVVLAGTMVTVHGASPPTPGGR